MSKETSEVPTEKKADVPVAGEGWNLFDSLHSEADRLFREFSQQWPGSLVGPSKMLPTAKPRGSHPIFATAMPAVDVVDLADKVEVRAELPGVADKDIDIEVHDNTLTIRAKKEESREEGEDKGRYYLSERRSGSVSRTLGLPTGLNADQVVATFANGLLTVSFPKTDEAKKQPKKVAISNT